MLLQLLWAAAASGCFHKCLECCSHVELASKPAWSWRFSFSGLAWIGDLPRTVNYGQCWNGRGRNSFRGDLSSLQSVWEDFVDLGLTSPLLVTLGWLELSLIRPGASCTQQIFHKVALIYSQEPQTSLRPLIQAVIAPLKSWEPSALTHFFICIAQAGK